MPEQGHTSKGEGAKVHEQGCTNKGVLAKALPAGRAEGGASQVSEQDVSSCVGVLLTVLGYCQLCQGAASCASLPLLAGAAVAQAKSLGGAQPSPLRHQHVSCSTSYRACCK